MNRDEVRRQSEAAYGQWCKQWRDHATKHASLAPHKSLADFFGVGIGRACVLIGNGYSLQENITELIEARDNVDIMACDKSLGHLLERGIKPDYCMVADANVDYEKYLKPFEDQLENTVLFMNVCGNTDWSHNGNWKDVYFYVNQDVLKSELEFSELSKCNNFIPAATNISNALVVLMTQSNNNGRNNHFGYDKYLLLGFDYSWRHDGGYYAFDHEGGGKRYYMKHIYALDTRGTPIYSSGNLLFSARWLNKYISAYKPPLPIVQCSKSSLVAGVGHGDLKEHAKYSFRPDDRKVVQQSIRKRAALQRELDDINQRLHNVGTAHFNAFRASL